MKVFKNKNNSLNGFFIFLLAAVFSVMSFAACEVGLGSAVDTQAPNLTFDNDTVGSGAVIRDSFMVRGSWTDDGIIKEVSATLKKTDGGSSAFINSGTVVTQESGKGTWSVVFDPFSEKIPDGSYEISITMIDTGKHASTITRGIVIDNTAPLVVLTRPGTKKGETSWDSYGQKFSLEGKAADDNDVSLIEVNIYEDAACTNLLKTIPLVNVPLTIDLDVAEYSATEVNDYSNIYNIFTTEGLTDKKGGTEYRYCSLTIYDGAKRYPADGSSQTDEDKKGNKTNTYYVNDDEIATLFTEYKITELYHILNGSFDTTASRAISTTSAMQKLTQQAITNSQFTINPENSPSFVVNSRSPLGNNSDLDEAKYQITSGNSNIQVEISAGLDKHAIKKDSVGIYLKECNKNGVVLDSAVPIWLVKVGAENHGEDVVEIVQSGTTYKFTTKNPISINNYSQLEIEKYYKIFVEGKDVKGNDILPSNNYAFKLMPNSDFIELSVTGLSDWVSQNPLATKKALTAKISMSGGEAAHYTISYKKDNDPYEEFKTITPADNTDIPSENQTLTITNTYHPTSITYKVDGDNGAKSSEKTYKLNYDNDPPVVENPSSGDRKIYYPTAADTQSPSFQFSGYAKDLGNENNQSGVSKVYLKISNLTGSVTTGDIPIVWTGEHWEKNIKYDDYKDTVFATEGKKKVEIWAEDNVGLKSEIVTNNDWIFDSADPVVEIDGTIASVVGGKIKLSGTASDANGIQKLEIIQKKKNDTEITSDITNAASWTTINLPFKSKNTEFSDSEFSSHTADGEYTYTIKATDNAGNVSTVSVTVTLNTIEPSIDFAEPTDWYQTKNISLSGSASAVNPSTVQKVYFNINPTGDVSYPAAADLNNQSKWQEKGWGSAVGTTNWAVNLPAAKVNNSNSNKLYFAVLDNVGNYGKYGPYTIKVDDSAPELTPLYYNISGTDIIKKAEGNVYVDGTKELVVYGEYYDNDSGVNTLTFKLKNDSITPKTLEYSKHDIVDNVTGTAITSNEFEWGAFDSEVKYFKATFEASAFSANKTGDLKVSGSNVAVSSVESKICSISFDNTKPELANVAFKSVDSKHSVYEDPVTHKYYVNKDYKFNITGVATDVGGGVESVKLSIGGDETDIDSNTIPSSWKFSNVDLSSQTDNSVTLTITVTDVAGNSKPYNYEFIFDQVAPKAQHWADKKNKDIYFRIGNADNDKTNSSTWETGDASPAKDADNTSVGKKYSFGSWGNDSTIQIRGSFDEFETTEPVEATQNTPAKPGSSGLKLIYYAIFEVSDTYPNPTSTQIDKLVAGTLAVGENVKVVGSFAPLDSAETKKIPYNKVSGKSSAVIDTHFNTQLAGFNADKSCLVLVAEDNVGNRAADTLAVTKGKNSDGTIGNAITDGTSEWNSQNHNTVTPYYIINKDMVVPEIESDIKQGLFTNGANDVTVTGTASDADSGLSKVTLSIKEQGIDYSVDAANPSSWSFTIPASTFSGLASGKSVTAYATAKDNAGVGNEKQISAATITIDIDAPTVDINVPSDADTSTQIVDLNGTISLSGTADDVYGIKKVLGLCYKVSTDNQTAPVKETSVPSSGWVAPSGWTKVSATLKDEDATTNWTFQNINTAKLDGTTPIADDSNVWFTIAVQDKAGNVGYAKPQKVKINQNTDRPVVKFTNLANEGTAQAPKYILKFGTDSQLEGNISDDDGNSTAVVEIFVVSKTKLTVEPTETDTDSDGWSKTTNGNEITWTHDTNGTTKYNKTTGDYTYTPADTSDGAKEVYFYVKDNNETVFYTAHDTAFNQPYQQYKAETSTKTPSAVKLEYKSDGTSPTISSVKILLSDNWGDVKNEQNAINNYFTNEACSTKVTAETTDNTKVYRQIDPGTSTVVGGTKKNKIKFVITANDGNGIKDMSLEYTPAVENAESTTITSSTGTFTATTTSVNTTWITPEIDVSNLFIDKEQKYGAVNVAVTANDQCGLFANSNPVFMVDNSAPSINISSPGINDEVSSSVSIAGQATDEGGAGNATINFLIPTRVQKTAQANSGKTDLEYYKTLAVEAGKWVGKIHGEKTPSAFEYVFNGDVNDNPSLDIFTKSDNSNTYGLTADDEGIYSVPIYFRSEDALGNISVIKFTVKYNPDADKPRTEISYPSAANYQDGNDYVTLGGTIRVTGSISIPSLKTTPEKVYIQISDDNGNFNDTDKAKASSTYGYTVKTVEDVHSDIGKTVTGLSTSASSAWWGIEAVRSSNAWSFNLNASNQMNINTGDKINRIKIRACGVNALGKMGAWSDPVSIHIDASAPEYSTKLYKFSSKPTAESHTPTAEKDYEPGMYLKDEWYIGIHLTDNDGIYDSDDLNDIKKIVVQRNSQDVDAADIVKLFSTDHKTLDLYIKLSNAAVQSYKIDVCDTADPEHWVYPTYEIQVDETAPVLSVVNTGAGYPLSMTKQRTSNNVITFGATATDEGSGFSRLAYYFKRGSSIEVPLPTEEDSSKKQWSVGTAYTGNLTKTEDNLYGVELSGTKAISGENTTFTSSSALASFIRKGGIVKMAGTYHLITDVSGNVVTIHGKIESAVPKAFFPAAFIVDNTSAEASTWADGVNTITGDDGDGVVESVKKSGTTWTWDTSIYAGELDDGEIKLVCVAFDVAENCAKSETTFMLTNKTPRLSKLYLATDLNGNGKYSDDELGTSVITDDGSKTVEKYYSALNAGSLQDVFTVYGNINSQNNSDTDSRLTMRDNMGIAFEFISGYEGYGAGQGALNYKLSVSQSAITDAESGITGELGNDNTGNSKFDNTTDSVTAGLIGTKFLELTPNMFKNNNNYGSYKELLVSGETGYSAGANYLNYLHITLWDSSNNKAGTKDGAKTENTYTSSNGVSSTYDTYASFGAQWTAFNIPLYMDLVDGLRPIVTINDPVPLSATEGHVDLSSTLSSTNFSSSNELDGDDKVSGKIKFTGTINDERRISEIKLTVNKSFSNTTVSGTTLATYSTTTGAFDNTTIVPNGATGLTFRILSSTFSTASGHTVTWELEVDSEKVGNNAVADKDVLFTLTANDGTGDGTGTHQIDIVPYITKLYTGLSDSAGEEFARSATGKYVVRAGETVRMYGYNLKAGTNAVKVSYTSGDPTSLTPTASNATETSTYGAHLKLPIGTDAKSGKVTITVNGVQSLNNLNTNPTFVSATDDTVTAYENNSQANGITNNRLNDDVELWVWDLGAFLTETDITSPMMKMDKNSNYYMSYGYGVPSMYVNKNGTTRQVDFSYNKFHNTNVIFDDNGNIFAVATNTDRVVNDSSRFVLYTPHNDYMPDYVDSSDKYEYQYRRTSKRHLEMAYNTATGVYNINRVKRPKLASYTDGANTYLGVVYFDYNNNDSPVRFRFGKKENGTPSFTQQGNTQYTFTYNAGQTRFETTSNTSLDGRYVMINSNYYKLTRVGTNNNRYRLSDYNSTEGFSSYTYTRSVTDATLSGGIMENITADGRQTDSPTYATSATGYHTIADKNTTKKGGEYAAVGIVPSADGTNGYVAVVAWYDASVRKVYYSYNTDPDTVSDTVWQTNAKELDTNAYTGWHVDLAVDDDGGIHIAYYNSAKGDLKYVYLSSYNATPSDPVTVDSYLSVGTNISVNVRKESGKNVPYIYYYNASSNQTPNSIKVAWRNDMTTLRDGAINDKFTGAWESMTIPTTNIPVDATVCGGVPTGGTYANTVVLGYMTDTRYEKAVIKK